jgi:hypothetical protein
VRLYALFLRYQGDRLSAARREDYARLLMHVIAIQFNQHRYHDSLPQVRLVPEEVAQDAAVHLLRKTRTLTMNHGGWRPLMSVLNTTTVRFVLTAISGRRRKAVKVIAATDYYGADNPRPAEQAGEDADVLLPGEAPTVPDLRRLLRSDDGVDRVVGDIVTRSAREAAAVERLYRVLRDRLLAGEGVPPHAALSASLQSEVSLELHGLVASRLVRLVRAFAR